MSISSKDGGWGDVSDFKSEIILNKLWPIKENIESIIQSSKITFPKWTEGSRVDHHMRTVKKKLSELITDPVVSAAFDLMLQVHNIEQLSKFPTPIDFYLQDSYFMQFKPDLIVKIIDACDCIINAALDVSDYDKITNFYKLTYDDNEVVKSTYEELGIAPSEPLTKTNPIVKINTAILVDRMSYIDILEPYLRDMEYVLKRKNLVEIADQPHKFSSEIVSSAIENDQLWNKHVFLYRPDLAPVLSWTILITQKLQGEQRKLFYRLMARELNKASCNNVPFVTLTASKVYAMVVQETGPLNSE